MLIQILYNKIEDKSKVLTSEKVATVKNTASHVTVTTQAGNSYTGDIVVGADGIHSTVRKQMWQEAQQTDPTCIDPSEEKGIHSFLFTLIRKLWADYQSPPGNIRMCIWYIQRRARNREGDTQFRVQRTHFISHSQWPW